LFKVIAFAVSAALAGIAGALFVPVVGIISPALLGIVPSIEMVIWVALGGRLALIGPIIGALLANYAKTGLSEQFPSAWLYLQGAMFVILITFAPKGIAGLVESLRNRMPKTAVQEDVGPAGDPEAEGAPRPRSERKAVPL
jgi:urea transport system permease protein